MTCGLRCASRASASFLSFFFFFGLGDQEAAAFLFFFLIFSLFSCPRLKFISTTLGSILPSPNSHVRVAISYFLPRSRQMTDFPPFSPAI
jgi:hypothetical protein